MIVYGSSGSKELAKEQITDICKNCNTQGSITLMAVQKYAHLYWIPIFPFRKSIISHCSNCNHTLKRKEMPDSWSPFYDNIKIKAKTPVWMYSGVIIFVAFLMLGWYASQQKDTRNAQLIVAPQSGDIFEIKNGRKSYTLFKVIEVEGDSVFIQMSEFETNKKSGLRGLKTRRYQEELFGYSKAELKQMLEDGEIMDIDRDEVIKP